MKHKIVKIETGFSEKLALDTKVFSTLAEFDIFVITTYSGDYQSNYMGYDKTDVVITFEDGYTYALRFDACPGETLVGHFAHLRRYYLEGNTPEWASPKAWQETKEEYQNFFNSYQI